MLLPTTADLLFIRFFTCYIWCSVFVAGCYLLFSPCQSFLIGVYHLIIFFWILFFWYRVRIWNEPNAFLVTSPGPPAGSSSSSRRSRVLTILDSQLIEFFSFSRGRLAKFFHRLAIETLGCAPNEKREEGLSFEPSTLGAFAKLLTNNSTGQQRPTKELDLTRHLCARSH